MTNVKIAHTAQLVGHLDAWINPSNPLAEPVKVFIKRGRKLVRQPDLLINYRHSFYPAGHMTEHKAKEISRRLWPSGEPAYPQELTFAQVLQGMVDAN